MENVMTIARVKYIVFLATLLLFHSGCTFTQKSSSDYERTQFEQLSRLNWQEVLFDPLTSNWQDKWTLDGLKAKLTTSEEGLQFLSGPDSTGSESHCVLWTKKTFEGDIRVDWEYTKIDDELRFAVMIYLLATGSDAEGYDKDISKWADKRQIPHMRTYFNHMNLIHISFAAFEPSTANATPDDAYIRARRYMPETSNGLDGTAYKPDYMKTGLFHMGVPHKITVIKKGGDLFMHVRNAKKELLCHWKTDQFPPVNEGRIAFRQMRRRGGIFKNVRILRLNQ